MSEKLTEKFIDFISKENLTAVLSYVALCFIAILGLIVIYDTKIIDLIYLFTLSDNTWAAFERIFLCTLIINFTGFILYRPLMLFIYKKGIEAKARLRLIYNLIQIGLAVALILYSYDALAYFNKCRTYRNGIFPVPCTLTISAILIGLMFIFPRMYNREYAWYKKLFRLFNGTKYCDDDNKEICVEDTVIYQHRIYKVDKIFKSALDDKPTLELFLSSYDGANIPLEEAAKVGGIKIVEER